LQRKGNDQSDRRSNEVEGALASIATHAANMGHETFSESKNRSIGMFTTPHNQSLTNLRRVDRLVIIGAGGHARACLEVLTQQTEFDVVGCLADSTYGELQRPYLGELDQLGGLTSAGVTHAFIAVGDSASRKHLSAVAGRQGLVLASAISPHAIVSSTAQVGRNVLVMHGAVVNAFAVIEDGVIINTSASIDHDCVVEEWAHVAPGATLGGDVAVGPHALVGIGAVILPGLKIGARATVGGGSVVVSDVPEGKTVFGNPAKPRP
jgi:UDP-perosamine 4-acetyltransferase